jgi:hypothetical protein
MLLRSGFATVGLTDGDLCAGPIRRRFATLQVDADGARVRSYGRNGAAVVGFPTDARLTAMVGLRNRDVGLVGYVGDVFPLEWAVARITNTGALDKRFGGGRTCGQIVGYGQDGPPTAVVRAPGDGMLVAGATQSDSESLELAQYRRAFTPGGVECFSIDARSSPLRLRGLLNRRGHLRLRVRRGVFAEKGRVYTACLGSARPGEILARWDGRVNRHVLRADIYTVNLELHDSHGRLLGRSYPHALKLPRRAAAPRRGC